MRERPQRKNGFRLVRENGLELMKEMDLFLKEKMDLYLKDGFRQTSVGEFSLTTPAHVNKIGAYGERL
jgi:hypothetical protein